MTCCDLRKAELVKTNLLLRHFSHFHNCYSNVCASRALVIRCIGKINKTFFLGKIPNDSEKKKTANNISRLPGFAELKQKFLAHTDTFFHIQEAEFQKPNQEISKCREQFT